MEFDLDLGETGLVHTPIPAQLWVLASTNLYDCHRSFSAEGLFIGHRYSCFCIPYGYSLVTKSEPLLFLILFFTSIFFSVVVIYIIQVDEPLEFYMIVYCLRI